MPPSAFDFDYIVIGSGFGGSVSALRLTQKGYRVAVLEAGKRWADRDFARSNWQIHKFLWLPRLFCYGIQRLTLLKDVLILSGAGVGGGSLVYANTLYVPPDSFFEHPVLQALGGKERLMPYYHQAQKMLGVTENPKLWPADHFLKATAESFGAADTFRPTPVGVFFGPEGQTVPDPYFGGEGPERTGCTHCGGCMVGCRVGAKNTLVKNYLFLAERLGATIIPETQVTGLRPLSPDGSAGYQVVARSSTRFWSLSRPTFTAQGVVFSAGVLGTLGLLLKLRERGRLPLLSDQLGRTVRTNSEAILGVTARTADTDYSQGIAITSSVYPDAHSHIEPVRYPQGSDFMGLLATVLTDGGGKIPRQLRYVGNILRRPGDFLTTLWPFGFARRSTILLFMQTLDNSIRVLRKRTPLSWLSGGLSSEAEGGNKAPSYIPLANEFARRMAQAMNAVPGSAINEVLLDVPTTAHILGGASIARDPSEGVINLRNQVFGYANLYVCDGSMIPANLGVNPSLTITALSEQAMAQVPVKPGHRFQALTVETAVAASAEPAAEEPTS